MPRLLVVLLLAVFAVAFPPVEINVGDPQARLGDDVLFASDCRERHVVQPGDTLNAIALHYDAYASHVAQASSVANHDLISVGQVLCIPRDSVRPACQDTIVVEGGDTLRAISRLYGVPIPAIRYVNGIRSQHRIYAGQVLCIPDYPITPTPEPTPTPTRVSVTGVFCRELHRVRYGETLESIARDYDSTVTGIVLANPEYLRELRENIVKAGVTLCIP